jgi:hypothetical protein
MKSHELLETRYPTPKQKDAVIYMQTEFSSQLEGLCKDSERVAAAIGGRVTDTFTDHKFAGPRELRPGLDSLLRRLSEPDHGIAYVIVTTPDQLARRTSLRKSIISEIHRCGASVVTDDLPDEYQWDQ